MLINFELNLQSNFSTAQKACGTHQKTSKR